MLTKKNFEAIAHTLHKHRPTFGSPNYQVRMNEWDAMVNTFADDFKNANPKFDRHRFIFTCEEGPKN